MSEPPDPELAAMRAVVDALAPLDEPARRRVLAYLTSRFGNPGPSREMASAGGKARAAKMTPERRSEVAKAAANARWNGDKPKPDPD